MQTQMKNNIAIRSILVLLTVLLMVGGADAQLMDSPWAKFHQNLNNTGQSSYSSTSDGTLKWSYVTSGAIRSSPAIDSNGIIYVGSDNWDLQAIYPNGTLKWEYSTAGSIESSPAIDSNGIIYVGSKDNNLHAVYPNGTLKWKYATGNDIYSSPAIDSNGIIYVGSYDGKLYAIYPNGTMKWNYTTDTYIYYSSPAIDVNGIIYIGNNNGNLYAIYPNGNLKWNYTTTYGNLSAPAIDLNGIIYVGSQDGKLYAINQNGTSKWNYTTGGSIFQSSPAIASDGTIYIGSNDTKLYAINQDGTMKWNYTTGNDIYSSPAIDSNGVVYIGNYENYIFAIYPNGALKWSYLTSGYIYSSPAIASDGMIYVGSYDGNLYAFESLSTYDLSGYVKDTNDLPIQDATLTFWNETFSIMTISNSVGYWNLSEQLSDGFYDFVVQKTGYADTQGYGSFYTIGLLETNITLYSVNINGTTYDAITGLALPNTDVHLSVPNYWGNETTRWFNTTSNATGSYNLSGFLVDKTIFVNASKSGYIHNDFNVTPIYAGNYIMDLYLMPTDPCPGKVCGLTLSYPWYQSLGSVNVTVSNTTFSNFTLSNTTTGYFEIPIYNNETYNLFGIKNKYTTATNNIIVTGGTNVSYLILHPIYNLTIKARDYATTKMITNFNTYKDNISVQAINGTVVYQVDYGIYTISVQATGYYPLQKTIFVPQDKEVIFDLTPISETIEITSPHYVKIIIQSITGKRYENTIVNVYNNSNVSVLEFEGISGTDGAVTFKLIQTTRYRIHFYNTAYNFNKNYSLYPTDSQYTLIPDINSITLINGLTYSLLMTNTSVTFTWNDVYNETLFVNMSISNVSEYTLYNFYSSVTLDKPTPSDNYSVCLTGSSYNIPTTMWNLMDHNGNDTHFYNTEGTTEYGFYVQSLNSPSNFSIWVNITNSTTNTFKWYYGYSLTHSSNISNVSTTPNSISLYYLSEPTSINMGTATLSASQSSIDKVGTLGYYFKAPSSTYKINITIPTVSHGTLNIVKSFKPAGYVIPMSGVSEWVVLGIGMTMLIFTGMLFGYNHAGIGALIVVGLAILLSVVGLIKLTFAGQGILAIAAFLSIIGLLRGRR